MNDDPRETTMGQTHDERSQAAVPRPRRTATWQELESDLAGFPVQTGRPGDRLCDEVPADVANPPSPEPEPPLAIMPADRDALARLVHDVVREQTGTDPTIDDDGDIALTHLSQPVWVRARHDQPAVEIFARIAHDVYSRRQAAVEIGLLNRDRTWVRWVLRDRAVWQQLTLPGAPFAPAVLTAMLTVFMETMDETRDDLALRLGATVA
ncbi:hypothetical protein Q6348_14140 [Isoptericola sp. b441]|uniref:TY-Chap central domain-containing protein n=1 Tax=Actinotalea lenta TaxID=3064654 RepID=A0ABT9DBS7_9CELL|nr:hypothetical protein [Isoptericola sp. b441]MDO8108334.1 hypothetical protein [Isoptericola sp. b441]